MPPSGFLSGWKRLALRLPPLRRLADRRAEIFRRLQDIEQRLHRIEAPGTNQAHDPASAPAAAVIPVAHMIDSLWSDLYGVYVRGWAHAFAHPVTRLVLASGEDRVEIDRFHDRPDLLRHYPDHPHVVHTGFAAYLPCRPFRPVWIEVVTPAGTGIVDVAVPPGAQPAAGAAERPAPMDRFVRAMNEAQGVVLEIGARPVGDMTAESAALFAPGCRYVAFDIHPAPGVDIVGDAHALGRHVAPGCIDGIFSVAVLEHLQAPWLVAAEINRALKPGGLTLHVVPQCWPVHELPNDFWRMSDEGLKVLFGPALGFEVLDAGMGNLMIVHPHPARRTGSWLEMPLAPAYGEAFILARKVADIAGDAVRWPGQDEDGMLLRSRAYPHRPEPPQA